MTYSLHVGENKTTLKEWIFLVGAAAQVMNYAALWTTKCVPENSSILRALQCSSIVAITFDSIIRPLSQAESNENAAEWRNIGIDWLKNQVTLMRMQYHLNPQVKWGLHRQYEDDQQETSTFHKLTIQAVLSNVINKLHMDALTIPLQYNGNCLQQGLVHKNAAHFSQFCGNHHHREQLKRFCHPFVH